MRATFSITALCLCLTTFAADLRPLFNGKDLSGWVNVNCHPKTFTVHDGMIVSTGKPTGVMRTEKQYENFILELEYRHMFEGGNAGLFVWADPLTSVGVPFARAIEVQILDGRNTEDYTSHGDLFAIHGAIFKPDRPHPHGWMRCLPSERRAKPPGEWNHYRVVCTNGTIQLAVNGKVVSGGSEAKPRKGYICLESEGSECHFRNIRIQELPSTKPRAEEIAPLAQGFQLLYNGLDLSGWEGDPGVLQCFKPNDWVLSCNSTNQPATGIWTTRRFKDFEFICDWRVAGKNGSKTAQGTEVAFVLPRSAGNQLESMVHPDSGGHVEIRSSKVRNNALEVSFRSDKAPGQWNRVKATLKKQHLLLEVNGQKIYDQSVASESGMRLLSVGRNPIGIMNRPGNIEFANIYVRELK